MITKKLVTGVLLMSGILLATFTFADNLSIEIRPNDTMYEYIMTDTNDIKYLGEMDFKNITGDIYDSVEEKLNNLSKNVLKTLLLRIDNNMKNISDSNLNLETKSKMIEIYSELKIMIQDKL